MILRNFDSLLQGLLLGGTYNTYSYSTRTEENWLKGQPGLFKDQSGAIFSIASSNSTLLQQGFFGSTLDKYVSPSSTAHTLCVGSNDADPTYDDYALSDISTLTVDGTRSCALSYDESTGKLRTMKTFINNTTEDIVVNEIGIYTVVVGLKAVSSNTNVSTKVLTLREKLDTPVTIAANGGAATFSLVVNLPLANKPASVL